MFVYALMFSAYMSSRWFIYRVWICKCSSRGSVGPLLQTHGPLSERQEYCSHFYNGETPRSRYTPFLMIFFR